MTVQESITGFEQVSLEELKSLTLMNRQDTKYVLHREMLPRLLDMVHTDYQILQIGERRLMQYQTAYYDTPGLFFYLCHHNGRWNRFKVRFRNYEATGETFFEIKKKINGNRTRKVRTAVPYGTQEMSETSLAFLHKHTKMSGADLQLSAGNRFERITLASQRTLERITVDMNILYFHEGKEATYPDIVVAEIKRGMNSPNSPMATALKRLGIRPLSFSKYCIGIVSLYDNVKYNNFKPRLLTINKIQNACCIIE